MNARSCGHEHRRGAHAQDHEPADEHPERSEGHERRACDERIGATGSVRAWRRATTSHAALERPQPGRARGRQPDGDDREQEERPDRVPNVEIAVPRATPGS